MRGLALIAFVFSAAAPAGAQDDGDDLKAGAYAGVVSPSEVLDSLFLEMALERARLAQTGERFDQLAVTEKYLAYVADDVYEAGDDPLDLIAIGDIQFFNFAPAVARTFYDPLLERDDWIGQHAWQRDLQMQFRAQGDVEGTRARLAEYAERFPPAPTDMHDLGQQVVNLAGYDFQNGAANAAIDLILREFERLPADAPYRAYGAVTRYADEIAASGRIAEVAAAVDDVLSRLRAARDILALDARPASQDPILTSRRPDWYWMMQDVRGAETFDQARVRQINALIAQLEAWRAGVDS